MAAWERYSWVDEATEATVAFIADPLASAEELLGRLGAVATRGEMTFEAALALQGDLYDDGGFDKRAVFQATRFPDAGGDTWHA